MASCKCGCGRAATTRTGYVKNHTHRKRTRWTVEDRGYGTPCWVWTLATKFGYGRTTIDGRQRAAHVIEWEKVNGQVPTGLQLDHLCRVRACVNPAHLEPVTGAENTRRGLLGKYTLADLREMAAMPRDDAMERFGVSYAYWYEVRARYAVAC